MDASGRWHNVDPAELVDVIAGRTDADGRRLFPRSVIELAEGEPVMILKANGSGVTAKFVKAEENRVTLRPTYDGSARPYLETAERVDLVKVGGPAVPAQVWDNRGGLIVLRTLPVSG